LLLERAGRSSSTCVNSSIAGRVHGALAPGSFNHADSGTMATYYRGPGAASSPNPGCGHRTDAHRSLRPTRSGRQS
jgi:hypothetical protein